MDKRKIRVTCKNDNNDYDYKKFMLFFFFADCLITNS